MRAGQCEKSKKLGEFHVVFGSETDFLSTAYRADTKSEWTLIECNYIKLQLLFRGPTQGRSGDLHVADDEKSSSIDRVFCYRHFYVISLSLSVELPI